MVSLPSMRVIDSCEKPIAQTETSGSFRSLKLASFDIEDINGHSFEVESQSEVGQRQHSPEKDPSFVLSRDHLLRGSYLSRSSIYYLYQ